MPSAFSKLTLRIIAVALSMGSAILTSCEGVESSSSLESSTSSRTQAAGGGDYNLFIGETSKACMEGTSDTAAYAWGTSYGLPVTFKVSIDRTKTCMGTFVEVEKYDNVLYWRFYRADGAGCYRFCVNNFNSSGTRVNLGMSPVLP